MVRINKVCLKEGYLDEMATKFQGSSQKVLASNGSKFVVNLAIFCFCVYQIVMRNFQGVAICMALITGFVAGWYWIQLQISIKCCFDTRSVIKNMYDSDLALFESGKNCALMQNGLVDFGSDVKSENVVKKKPRGYLCYYFALFKLNLDDLPKQSESLLTINLVPEESNSILTLKAVVVDEEGS